MRIKINNDWIAGHPDYDPAVWSSAEDAVWAPQRAGDWQAAATFERVHYEDTGGASFTLSFSVARAFETQRLAADFITRMMSRAGAHPWSGEAEIRFDTEGGGTVTVAAGPCVLQLNGALRSLNDTGRLTLIIPYLLAGGVLGAQPVFTEPVAADQEDIIPEDPVDEDTDYS